MISCPKCGKENQDHYKFCLGCGNELPRESGGGGARAFHPTPPAGVPAVGMGGAGAGAAMRAPTGPGFAGGAPAPNPFAASSPAQGGMSSGSFGGGGAPAPSPFGGGSPQANPFGAPSSPGATPAAASKPPPAAASSAPASTGAAAPSGVPAVCPSCGSPNPRGNRFCITCGSDVLALAGTPAVGSPAAPVAAAVNPFAPPSAPASAPFAPPSGAGAPAPLGSNGGGAPVPMAAPPPPPVPVAGAVASRARLVLIRPDGSEGGMFQLNEGTTVIGRETGPLFASDTFLSPRHATFTVNGSTVGVRDEGALNGVYVRIERQAPVEIRDTDVFRIGQEILRYEAYKPVGGESDGTERQGSQIEGLVGRISLVVGRDVTGNAFPIPITGLFLGRERGDILFPEDGYVSGLHCQLSVENGRLMLTDTGSSNGTYVRIRGERAIRNNDLLLLGQQLFRLTM